MPSKTVTALPATPVPFTTTEVDIVAVTGAEIVGAAGFGGMTVTEYAALGWLVTAATSVWVAVSEWIPTPKLTVICQVPFVATVPVPTWVEPSYSAIVSPAIPVPLTVTGVVVFVWAGVVFDVIAGGTGCA